MERPNFDPVYLEPLDKLQAAIEVKRYTVTEANIYAQAYIKHLKKKNDRVKSS